MFSPTQLAVILMGCLFTGDLEAGGPVPGYNCKPFVDPNLLNPSPGRAPRVDLPLEPSRADPEVVIPVDPHERPRPTPGPGDDPEDFVDPDPAKPMGATCNWKLMYQAMDAMMSAIIAELSYERFGHKMCIYIGQTGVSDSGPSYEARLDALRVDILTAWAKAMESCDISSHRAILPAIECLHVNAINPGLDALVPVDKRHPCQERNIKENCAAYGTC